MISELILEGLRRFEENVEAVTDRAEIRAEASKKKHENQLDLVRGDVSYSEYHKRKKEIRREKNDDILCSFLDGIERRIDRW